MVLCYFVHQAFEITLNMRKQWHIELINLDTDRNCVDIRVNFMTGGALAI